MQHKVLFVDDEPHITASLKRALRKKPYKILSASSAKEALNILEREPVDVVISDEMMPGMLGSEFLAMVCRKYPETIRIILTGHANLEMAIKGINEGEIYRFLTKPCNETDLAITIHHALKQKQLMTESRRLLKMVKNQSDILERLKKEHPGITSVKRNSHGAIVIDDMGYDLDTLIQQINAEVNRCENIFLNKENEG